MGTWIFLMPTSKLIPILLTEFRDSQMGGHFGTAKTFHRLASQFFGDGMRRAVQEYVRNCTICQQVKYSTKLPQGLLVPLPVPQRIWEELSMDFITCLPKSKGKTVILVVVDRLSKYSHMGALDTHYNATKVAELFVNMVVKLHGFPKTIVSDRDTIFLSHFWRELFRLSGTKLHYSTAYHP